MPYGQRNVIVPLASYTPAYRNPSENNVSSACSCNLAKWCHCVYVMRCAVFGTNPKCHEDRNLILCLVHWVHSGHRKSSLWQKELGWLTNGKLPQTIRYGFFCPCRFASFRRSAFLVAVIIIIFFFFTFVSCHQRRRRRYCCFIK